MSDDGAANEQMARAKITEIAERLKAHEKVEPVTVRELLGWFGISRRRRDIWRVQGMLYDNDLHTEPDFRYTYLNGLIEFKLGKLERDHHVVISLDDLFPPIPGQATEGAEIIEFPGPETAGQSRPITTDPTYRIGKLKAANLAPHCVQPNDSLATAITIMLENDFSQLPVMTTPREVKGVVSWASVGARLALGLVCNEVRECMDRENVISSETSLFDAINSIAVHQYALIRDMRGQNISGIVTTTDLSIEFQQLSEPFLLLGEIENHIRVLIQRGQFTEEEIDSVIDSLDGTRPEKGFFGLTFEGYKRLLQGDKAWRKVGLRTDRKLFLENLERIRIIRNDVMHFDPDGIADDDKEVLRKFTAFLQRVQPFLRAI